MSETLHYTKVEFHRFKAFKRFSLSLRHTNMLVGPNNAGKSTILAAFRILAAGIRLASRRKPVPLMGPQGHAHGYKLDLDPLSVAAENVFFDYDDAEPAQVVFHLSSGGQFTLYFPEVGACHFLATDSKAPVRGPAQFKKRFNAPIGFVPILGPVDQVEPLYGADAARRALFNYRAARNFRNIWHHFPEEFDSFRELIRATWPGMDVDPPTLDMSSGSPMLHMFCPEDRIPREICWAGFGFQVWCQMLTHVVQSKGVALFLIDEPDIYLHSELQRQLLGILQDLGPDILIATHSTEMVSEAEPDDIVLVDKRRRHAKRIAAPRELGTVFDALGSSLNPVLTQLAKTRKVLFVEGRDFKILGRFARKAGHSDVGHQRTFAVVPVEGFRPERIRSMKLGMEATLGVPISAAAVLDRDFRSDAECNAIKSVLADICDPIAIHNCKEIENMLLVPGAIDEAARRRVVDRNRRTGNSAIYDADAASIIEEFAADRKAHVLAQHASSLNLHERAQGTRTHMATSAEQAIAEVEKKWETPGFRFMLIPGKDALKRVNQVLEETLSVSVTAAGIIDAMKADEVPVEMNDLLQELGSFSAAVSPA